MIDQDKRNRYTASDLLALTPGQRVLVDVLQEHIDLAEAGNKRNCAFVRALHSAIESCYRAEVSGNHVYVWIKYGDEKWMLEFYMTEEVWTLANMFDSNRQDVHPTTIPIHFRLGKQTNRQRKTSRDVHKHKPDAPGAKLESQVLVAKNEGGITKMEPIKPIVKPIAVPGQKASPNGLLKSRWVREDFIIRKNN